MSQFNQPTHPALAHLVNPGAVGPLPGAFALVPGAQHVDAANVAQYIHGTTPASWPPAVSQQAMAINSSSAAPGAYFILYAGTLYKFTKLPNGNTIFAVVTGY